MSVTQTRECLSATLYRTKGATAMRRARLLMFGLLICWPAAAQGAVLTFAFEGVVDQVGYDPSAPIDIQVGDKLIYEYTFDTNPPYFGGGAFAGLSASIIIGDDYSPVMPDNPINGPPVQLIVYTSNPGLLTVRSHVGFAVPGVTRSGYVTVALEGRLRPGNESPPWWPLLSPPDLSSDFSGAAWRLNVWPEQYGGISYQVSGTVTRSYQVPEPSAIPLVLSGFAIITKRRRCC